MLLVGLAAAATAVMLKSASEGSMPSKAHASKAHAIGWNGIGNLVENAVEAIPDLMDAIAGAVESDEEYVSEDGDEEEMVAKRVRTRDDESANEEVQTGMRMKEIIRDVQKELGAANLKPAEMVNTLAGLARKELAQAGVWALDDEAGPDAIETLDRGLATGASRGEKEEAVRVYEKVPVVIDKVKSSVEEVISKVRDVADEIVKAADEAEGEIEAQGASAGASDEDSEEDGISEKDAELIKKVEHGVETIWEGMAPVVSELIEGVLGDDDPDDA